MPSKLTRVLVLGDIVGQPGMRAVFYGLPKISNQHHPDLIIANVENSADGHGTLPEHIRILEQCGVRVFTGGNHTWDKREFFKALEEPFVLRPANYSKKLPGKGMIILSNPQLAVINLQGRSRLVSIDDPFVIAQDLVQKAKKETLCIVVDFHAEATDEKEAMALHLDGMVSAVLGTHTHTPTQDERYFPKGTFFLTDLGMCGSTAGVIGGSAEASVERMLRGIPAKSEPPQDQLHIQGILLDIDNSSGKVQHYQRILFPVDA